MAALVVGVVGAVGAVPTAHADPGEATPLSVPGMAVSLAQAGELRLWGDNSAGQSTVPASLSGVAISQVVMPGMGRLALTADGQVVGWGSNVDRLDRVPTEVAGVKVAQIATHGGYAGAVTRDGRVLMWGKNRAFATPLDVPAGLTGVKQLALTEYAAAALKADGSVVAWGQTSWGQTAVPAGLKATAIVAQYNRFIALTEQGTVVAWGYPYDYPNQLPASLTQPGNVKAIAASRYRAVALLADNTLVMIDGAAGVVPVPAEIAAAEPVLLANGSGDEQLAIVDTDRNIRLWAVSGGLPPGSLPQNLGAPVQIVLGDMFESPTWSLTGAVIVTKLLRAELPQVTGTAQPGSVLTGVPGTFSAVPDSVVSGWLVDGQPVPGTGAQLTVTTAMVGKAISYRSTATKAGETATSTSAAVTAANPPPPPPVPVAKVASTTKVTKTTVAKKAASITVAGKVTASKSPAGKAKVTINKGKKTILATSVNVSANGTLKLTVKKFAKLVAKKLKAKGKKAKTAYRGRYVVTISYAGNTLVNASAGSWRFTIKK